jgi:hypothetical protein
LSGDNFYKHALTGVVGVLLTATAVVASTGAINALKLPDISHWDTEIFSGITSYELVTIDNKQAIKAISNQSASGLVRKMEVDLTKTPYLNWSWKIDSTLNNIDETKKSGDDYAARVYVVISGGLFFWRTRAISYAWASKQPKDSSWPNAFTGNAIMVAAESGPELAGQWVTEKRNLLEDIKKLHGIDKDHIDAVAIMTDTDNSKQSATAYYGDIYFTEQ